jgi:hypothetical protein
VSSSETTDNVEVGSRERQKLGLLCVVVRERIGDDVVAPRLVLHGEVEVQEFADLMMLRDG